VLGAEVQIVLSERDQGDGLPDQAVLSRRTWRVSDLVTKLAMIRADLGWGNLPQYLVADDLAKGTLVQVHPLAWSEDEHVLSLAAVVREGSPPGPAHAWLMDALEHECSLVAGGAAPAASVSTKARSPSAKRKPVPHAGGIGRRTR
jgi:DNA-binding transcriptional LysR family regulator